MQGLHFQAHLAVAHAADHMARHGDTQPCLCHSAAVGDCTALAAWQQRVELKQPSKVGLVVYDWCCNGHQACHSRLGWGSAAACMKRRDVRNTARSLWQCEEVWDGAPGVQSARPA